VEANGRKGRRAACVLAQDLFHYRIYDLDGHPEDEESLEVDSDPSDEVVS